MQPVFKFNKNWGQFFPQTLKYWVGVQQGQLVVDVINVDAYLFLAFSDLTVHLDDT